MSQPLRRLGRIAVLAALCGAAAASAQTLSAAGEGRRLYLKLNCYGCHGMRGAGGMGPRISGGESDDLREVLLEGSDEGMPSYRKIVSATDIAHLGAYLRSIGTAGEPRFMDWWVARPTK